MPAILQRTVCVMSTDKENNQIEDMKVEEKEKEEVKKVEANDVEKKEPKDVKEDDAGGDSELEKEKVVQKKSPTKPKEAKKKKEEVKSEEEDHDESEEEEKDEDEEEVAEKPKKEKGVPLLDQPLSVSGPRQRKGVERLSVAGGEHKEPGPIEIPEGRGVSLGSISVVEYNISRIKGDDLKKLHQLLFGRTAKPTFVKKNIRKFNGFDFDADSDLHEKKKAAFLKLESSALKDIAGVLNLTKGGPKEDVAARVLDYLMEPTAPAAKKGAPATSTAAVLTKGGRPKRSAAAKANNKGYSESEDEDDHKRGPRSRRAKGKRVNLKDESSSEDEREKKRDSEEEDKASEASVEEPPSSDESEDGGTKKKRTPAKSPPAKKAAPPKKAAPAKKAEKKATPAKRKAKSEEEEDDESSSDDVPLSKKIKAPPTDEEIKTYVKQILEGANLEEITMKTVCKQVYSHYPDFDLAHKKDFIKTTVKSLIST